MLLFVNDRSVSCKKVNLRQNGDWFPVMCRYGYPVNRMCRHFPASLQTSS